MKTKALALMRKDTENKKEAALARLLKRVGTAFSFTHNFQTPHEQRCAMFFQVRTTRYEKIYNLDGDMKDLVT